MRFFLKRGPERLSVTVCEQELQVAVRRHARAKRLILRLEPGSGAPVLTLPRRTSLQDAQRFLDRSSGWLQDRLQVRGPATPLRDGSVFPLRGRPCRIVALGGRGLVRLVPGDGEDELHVPGDPDHLPRRATDWLKREARRDISAAVERYAGELGRSPTGLRIGDARSRWGSCSAGGRLAFSWRLVLAPPSVLAYVAAHEVAHLIEMNHGPRFWALVRRLDTDFATSRAWLKANGAALHAVGGLPA